ncbi:hypothetical protein ACQYRI_21745 [Salmonella enterica]
MPYENKIVHGCMSPKYPEDNAPSLKNERLRPTTQEGFQVAEYAEKIRLSDKPPGFIFICLAAATHPDIIDGKTLVLTKDNGEIFVASDPVKGTLWPVNTQPLTEGSQQVAEVRIDDVQYLASVDNRFIAVEGSDAFYKAILSAVKQCSSDTLTTDQVKNFRFALADIIEQHADELWQCWRNWYEGNDNTEPDKDIWYDAQETPEKTISLTEDCKRCLKQLLSHFGEVKENELFLSGLAKFFPMFPLEIVLTAQNLYSVVKERKNLDLAILNSLTLVSTCLAKGNILASTAQFIRNSLIEYFDDGQIAEGNSRLAYDHFFTALALLAIAGRHYWRNNNPMPQRSFLQVPVYLARILQRASLYWSQLERMALLATPDCSMQVEDGNLYECVNEPGYKQRYNRELWTCKNVPNTDLTTQCSTQLTAEELQRTQTEGYLHMIRRSSSAVPDKAPIEEPVEIPAAASAGRKQTSIEMTPLMAPVAVTMGAQLPAAISRNRWTPGVSAVAGAISAIGAAAGLGWGLYNYITKSSKRTAQESNHSLVQPLADSRLQQKPHSVVREILKQGMRSQAVQKSIVDPLSAIINDSMKGQSLSGDEKKQRRQQSLSLAISALRPTLSMEECRALYQGSADKPLAERFTAREGYIHVAINGQRFRLWTLDDDTPYIIDNSGKLRFIRFNQNDQSWEYVDEIFNTGYSAVNGVNREQYRIAVSPFSRITIDNVRNLATLQNAGGKNITGVFIAGDFIPAWGSIKDDVIYTDTKLPSRVIVRNDYGWEFERASSSIDDYVKIMLTEQNEYIDNPAQKYIGATDTDGVSMNRDAEFFVKNNYLYYPIEGISTNIYSLSNDMKTIIEYDRGIFKLRNNIDVLRSLQNHIEITPLGTFRIETEALNYIKENAARTKLSSGFRIANGLYKDARSHEIIGFIVNGISFKVKTFTDNHLHLERIYGNQSIPLILRLDADTWIRIRGEERKPYYKYKTVYSYYTLKPEDTTPNYISVKIEENLHRTLQKIIDNNENIDFVPGIDQLSKVNKFTIPVYYKDKKNQSDYFLYKGRFFPAIFTDATDLANPTGLHSLSIFSRGDLFSKANPIATVVLENRGKHVEIKTQEAALSEMFNISQKEACLLVENRPWRSQAGMVAVEEAVSEAQAITERITIALPKEVTKKQSRRQNIAIQRQLAISKLYPSRIKRNQLEFFKLTADKKTLNDSEQKYQQTITDIVNFIKQDIIKLLDNTLYYNNQNWPIVHSYLNEALGVYKHEYLSDFSNDWQKLLHRIETTLNKDDIYLVQGKSINLTQDEKEAGAILFISTFDNNIYINIDKMEAGNSAQIRLITELIQAVAYKSGLNRNLFDIKRVNGTYIPVKNAIEDIAKSLTQNELTQEQLKNVQAMSKTYLKNIPAYSANVDALVVPETLAYLVKYDPAFRAWLIRYSASMVTLLSLDAFYLLSRDKKNTSMVDTWINKYGELRGKASTVALTTTPPTDAMATWTSSNRISPDPAANHLVHNKGVKLFRDGQQESELDLEQERRREDVYIPGVHDKVFLPDLKENQHNDETEVFVPGYGNVKTIVIKGLECLGDKKLTAAQELRNIGKAFQKPFIENTLAWQETYHLDFENKDCPSPEEVHWTTETADVVDTAFTTLMMIPQFWPVFFLQTILGPFLQQLANDIEGREVSASDRLSLYLNAILQAITLGMIKASTLKGSQRIRAFPAPRIKGRTAESPAERPFEEPTEKPEDIFHKRFKSYKDGKEEIEVDGTTYPMLITEDEQNLMISDTTGRYRFIRFNQWNEKWEFTEKTLDDTYSRINQEKYRKLLIELSNDATIELGEHDVFTIKEPGKWEMTGVFIGIDFIPAQLQHIGEGTIAYTITESVPYEDQRVLIQTKYGWEFEASSAKMDNNLAFLLDSGNIVHTNIAEDAIGAISEKNGICYDDDGLEYIKRNHKYYKIESQGSNKYKLTNHESAEIEFKNGYFSLQSADNFVFTLENTPVQDGSFFLESAALRYLYKNALTSIQSVPHPLGKGIYEDNSHLQIGLLIDNTQFVATKFANNELHIQYRPSLDKPGDIKLWSSNKVWYLSRETAEESAIEYVQCRPARAPGLGTICLRSDVTPEKNLHRLLKASTGDVPAPDDLETVSKFTIPYLYQSKSTQGIYFRYNNKYFTADVLDESNIDNPTGYPCVRIFSGSDFYNQKAIITTIVSVHDENPVKLVDMLTFITNRLGGNTKEALQHIKKAPYIDVEDIDALDRLIIDTKMSGKSYIEMPDAIDIKREQGSPLPEASLQELAKKSLFSEAVLKNTDYTINIYDLTPPPKTKDAYLTEAVLLVDDAINHLEQRLLPSVLDSLRPDDFSNPLVEDYLTEVLDNNSPAFIADVQASLNSRIDIALKGLRKRKVKLVSITSKSENQHVQYPRTTDRAAYTHPDDNEHLFINIDMIDISNNAKYATLQDLSGAILTEIFKSTGYTSHIIDLPMNNGIYINIKDAFKNLQTNVETATLHHDYISELDKVILRYQTKSTIYKSHADLFSDITKKSKKFSYIFENDSAFKFHCIANSDDFMALITQDIYYWGEANSHDSSTLNSWLRKYGVQRGMEISQPIIDSRTNTLALADIAVQELSRFNPSWTLYVEPVRSMNKIYITTGDTLFLSYDHEYYELSFIGKSGRVVALGAEKDARHAYYYDPDSGDISPILSRSAFYKTIEYNYDLDLYALSTPGSDVSEVYKYDKITKKLVPTGANRIIPMFGKVTRIEFPGFDIYHTPGASSDIYLQGYGQLLDSHYTVPSNVKVGFYAAKGHHLSLYRNSIEHLLEDRLPKREITLPGETIDDYNILSFNSLSQSYYHLARKFNKDVIKITTESISLEKLLQGVSNIYPNKKIELHLFMGRSSGDIHLPKELMESGGAKTQTDPLPSHISGTNIPPGSITQFVPLPKNINYLTSATLDLFEKEALDIKFERVHYDVFRGLDTGSQASSKIPPYILETRQQISDAMKEAVSTLEQAFIKLTDPDYEEVVEKYLSYAIDNTNKDIIEQVHTRLQDVTLRVRSLLKESQANNYDNIVIISTKLTKDPKNPDLYISDFDFGEDLEVAYVIQGDSRNRVYIVNDLFFNIKRVPEEFHDKMARLQIDTMIHEHSHLAVSSIDAAYVLDSTQAPKDAQYIFNKIKEIVETQGIEGNDIADKFMARLYRHLNIDPLDGPAANKLIKDNPALMVNIVLENADSLSWYLYDIAKLEPASQVPRSRRAISTASPSFSEALVKLLIAIALKKDS